MPEKAVLVTGPRSWGAHNGDRGDLTDNEPGRILAELAVVDHYVGLLSPEVIVFHGGCRGLDSVFGRAAEKAGNVVVRIPYFGFAAKRGGFLRNQAMVHMVKGLADAGWETRSWAFGAPGESKGTDLCADLMEAAGLRPVWVPRPVDIRVSSS